MELRFDRPPLESRREPRREPCCVPTFIKHDTAATAAPEHCDDNNNNDGSSSMIPTPMTFASWSMECRVPWRSLFAKGLKLAPIGMTGPEIEPCTVTVADAVSGQCTNVKLIPSTEMEEVKSSLVAGLHEAAGADDKVLAIDYTHPLAVAVNDNAQFYVEQSLPFVMGTTGGDREQLAADVQGNFCVIAPNMGKQIVAMQAALESLAQNYPASFAGYQLAVTESHQKSKADTSGTAKAVIDSIKTLAADEEFSYDDITMIRDDQSAIGFDVPANAMQGHAFHTYTLTSPDGTVQFQLQHNVAGRTVYAEGTADAAKFLAKKLQTESEPRNYNMINVLEEGALE